MKKKPTTFQRKVLLQMAEGNHLFAVNRHTTCWLERSGMRVPYALKVILKNRGWIEEEPDSPNRPSWRSDYRITEVGRQAAGRYTAITVGLSEEGETQPND